MVQSITEKEDTQAGSGGVEAGVITRGDGVQESLRSSSEEVVLRTGRLPCENSRGGKVSTVLVHNINKLLVKAAVKSIFFPPG